MNEDSFAPITGQVVNDDQTIIDKMKEMATGPMVVSPIAPEVAPNLPKQAPDLSVKDPAEETVPASNTPVLVDDKPAITVRTEETGDKVYLLRDGKRYWVKNPSTLGTLGFYLGQEKKLPFSELLQHPEGEPIDLTVPPVIGEAPNMIYPWNRPLVSKPSSIWG